MKMEKKLITLSVPVEIQEKAKSVAKEVLGSKNISALFTYWVNRYDKTGTID